MALVASFGTPPILDRAPNTSIAPYNPEAYNSLPNLRHASEQFQQLDARTAIVGPIRDLFLKNKVHEHLGIALLHKHFPIRPTERLVDCRNISAPWDMGDDTDAVTRKYDSLIQPRSFRLIQGELVPYEFELSDANLPPQVNQAFVSEMSSLLCQHGLDQVLGLRVLDKHDSELTVEVTESNVNIMIRRGIVPEEELVQALWVFAKDEDQACHCREFCRRDSKGNHFESNHTCG
ncbi:hypothetical protein FALCPG4_015278 [Fusarium falciforme]